MNDVDLEGVTDLMELSHDADFWKELGDKCLACGQCTMVCPTCTCYNIIEENTLNKDAGTRKRYWDSCMFKDFSLTAGDHNFRAAKTDRLKLWYTHKLKAFIGHFGSPSCVGCGRCIVTCPVDIYYHCPQKHAAKQYREIQYYRQAYVQHYKSQGI